MNYHLHLSKGHSGPYNECDDSVDDVSLLLIALVCSPPTPLKLLAL